MIFFADVTITHEYVKLPTDTTNLRLTADFLIIGAGFCGLTTALALRRQMPAAVITVYERESEIRLPDAAFPFLGVRVSLSANGRVFAGLSAWLVLTSGIMAIIGR